MPDPNPHAARLRSIAALAPTDRAEALIAAADEIERLERIIENLLELQPRSQLHAGTYRARVVAEAREVLGITKETIT